MRKLCLCVAVCVLTAYVATAVRAQPPSPKPGPEHEQLKQLVGTWDATVTSGGVESKGVMTYKMELGGLWLAGHYKGNFGDMKFEGRGLDTYDVNKKKYVGVWFDSMSTYPMVSEGTYDKETKKMTMVGEGPGMDGKMVKMRHVTEYKDNDNIIFTMNMPGPDGKELELMTIKYKRRK